MSDYSLRNAGHAYYNPEVVDEVVVFDGKGGVEAYTPVANLRSWQDHAKELIAIKVKLETALSLIASPKRPDGTYNLSREACEQLAIKALNELSM